MKTVILIDPDKLTTNTILGGNIDVSRYLPCIKDAQKTRIRPLLGKELYEKIMEDFDNDSLTGLYLELYEDYLEDLVIYSSAEIYLSVGAYNVSDAGITKLTSLEGTTSVTKNEVDFLVKSAKRMYDSYRRDVNKWLKENGGDIPEYKQCQSNSIIAGNWSLRKRN